MNQTGVVGLLWHAPSLTSSLSIVEAEPLPSAGLSYSSRDRYYGLIRLLTERFPGFRNMLIPEITEGVGLRPREISPVPSLTVTAFRSPYAGEFFEADFQVHMPLPWPSPHYDGLGSL